jgi:hypothetical protein
VWRATTTHGTKISKEFLAGYKAVKNGTTLPLTQTK